MEKMIGNKKKFGRCNVSGHGCKCEVSQDIQQTAITRAKEKSDLFKEMPSLLSESQDHLDPELQQLLYDNIDDLYA